MAFLPSIQARIPLAALPPLIAAPGLSPFAGLARTGVLPAFGFELRFFPVYDFQRQSVAALFCTPMYASAGAEAIYGHKAFGQFDAGEWAAIDCAILRHAVRFAARLARHEIVAAIGASVSFATLSDPAGRRLYREALRAVQAREQAALVLKIEGVPDRTGGQRIAEIVSCVRGLAPRIWVHLPGSHIPLGGHEALHAAGVVLSMPARLPLHGMRTEARWLMRTATLQSALACMDHVDSAAELDVVRAEGIRFVAGHALDRPAVTGDATLEEIRASLYGVAAQKFT